MINLLLTDEDGDKFLLRIKQDVMLEVKKHNEGISSIEVYYMDGDSYTFYTTDTVQEIFKMLNKKENENGIY